MCGNDAAFTNLPGSPDCPRVRIGLVCNKLRTQNWANPIECECERLARYAEEDKQRENAAAKFKHLSDIEFLNQNARTPGRK